MTSGDLPQPPRSAHVDADTLALLALGEHADETTAAHVASCADCEAELRSLSRVVTTGRSLTATDWLPPPSPPSAVWERIAAEAQPTVRAAAWPARLLIAAAVGLVVGVAGALGWQAIDDAGEGSVVAQATLEPLPDKAGTGTAVVEGSGSARELAVTIEAEPPPDAFLEVWLLSPDAKELVSLGILDDAEGRFDLPPGLELTDFPVVDISIEPYDGDPTHSSDSLVRGELEIA